ncbi:hypothetical protein [Streptomyces sp. WAC 05379]|uniref:NucA/NucB deoxyribonuclease domain-containing protein n=1 Tax=Streptomyces sp. WAC 05379 TaxID=2203207 RepID=UPI00163BF12C|nr:hypothetical protein [Streptomyces sp. WAC 05379]
MLQYRNRRWFLIAATAAAFAAFTGAAPASAITDSQARGSRATVVAELTTLIPEATPGSDEPAREADASRLSAAGEICTSPDENGRGSCIEYRNADTMPGLPSSEADAQFAAVAPPQWCEDAQGVVYATRTQACRIDGVLYHTWVERNGVRTTTGEANLLLINYSYGSTSDSRIAHQLDVTAFSGWGDALKGSYSGTARVGYSCTKESGSFTTKPIQPLNQWHTGEAFFDSTATAAGAAGECGTGWNLTFTNPGYTSSSYVVPVFRQFRCDNNTAGRTDPGCVVPWYASAVYYSQAANPDLASHVSRAQASGLPGATFEAPLTRTTDPAVNQTNRDRACGDAPSVNGKSCDEYPVASSKQGLSAGGTRRTFDGCGFPGIPAGQGPTGVSVCMITAAENNSQGGLHSAMYRSERVLQDDPFRVIVIP